MIDTVVLRFHDVKFHRPLIQVLTQLSKSSTYAVDLLSKGYETRDGRIPRIDNPEKLQAFVSHKKDTENAEVFLRFSNKKVVSNSFNYNINFHVNIQRDFIELNFSLPKYLYGTNVFMAIEHWITKKHIAYSDRIKLEYYAKNVRSKLIEVVYHLLVKRLGIFDVHIDWKKIEVNRIDFCFNQVFKTKSQALTYLKYQKQKRKLYSRDSSDTYRNYETSLFYATKKYSAKIYHKGEEFRKHDSKELDKLNRDKGREIFNIPKIQDLADKTLRYEVTFRNSEMSRIFKKKIFRSKCPTHQKLVKAHAEIEKKIAFNDRLAERINKYHRSDKDIVVNKLRKEYKPITKPQREVYDFIEKCLNQNTLFMIEIPEELDQFNWVHEKFIPRMTKFSNHLTAHCFLKFRTFIEEFQLQEQPNRLKIAKLIDDFNKINKKTLNKSSMLKFFDLWTKYSEKELIEKELFSKATVYRFLQKFKLLGISNKAIIPSMEFDADTNLKRYDSAVFHPRNFMNL